MSTFIDMFVKTSRTMPTFSGFPSPFGFCKALVSQSVKGNISADLPKRKIACNRRPRKAFNKRQVQSMAGTYGPTQPAGSATYISQTLRAGTVQEHAGTVVIFGDVKHGATVIAGGDVLVWGRLHGEVHAGGKSNRQATIAALEMSPQHLRIADIAAYGSRQMRSAGHPEIAVVNNNGLQIELLPCEGLQSGAVPHLLAAAQPQQNPPASAAMFTGAYILVAGLALMLFPVLTFSLLFDPRLIPVGWIRVGGVLAALFGIYYLGAGYGDRRHDEIFTGFYQATVWGRCFLFAAFSLIVWRKEVERTLLIPAVVNLLGAVTMQLALLRQRQSAQA